MTIRKSTDADLAEVGRWLKAEHERDGEGFWNNLNIIEGAHAGAGLGHQFLKHVERCRLLIHLIDCSAEGDDREPMRDLETLNRELALYSEKLAAMPQVVAANKIDLPDARERAKKLATKLKRKKIPVVLVSSATGEGLGTLMDMVAERIFAKPAAE